MRTDAPVEMDAQSNPVQRNYPLRSLLLLVVSCVLIMPATVPIGVRTYVAIEGVVVAVVSFAFSFLFVFQCPYRPLSRKALTYLSAVLTWWLDLWAVMSYIDHKLMP